MTNTAPTANLGYHLSQLAEVLVSIHRSNQRLILIVGGDWQQRTELLKSTAAAHDLTYLSLGLPLSRVLLDLLPHERPLAVEEQVVAMAGIGSRGLALDHVEILFDPDLKTDPLRLFEVLARDRVVLAAWPGEYDGQRLTYAEPAHPEHYSRAASDIQFYSLEVMA